MQCIIALVSDAQTEEVVCCA